MDYTVPWSNSSVFQGGDTQGVEGEEGTVQAKGRSAWHGRPEVQSPALIVPALAPIISALDSIAQD